MPDSLQTSFVNYSEKAPNQTLETNCRPAEQLDGSGNLSATLAADRAFPAAVTEPDRWRTCTAIGNIVSSSFS
jgi:hypothetical protein